MGFQLNTPDAEALDVVNREDVPYTHVQMVQLHFNLPFRGQPVSAWFEWSIGTLDAEGKFVVVASFVEDVDETATRNFLTQQNTEAKATFTKLEEAMFNRLVNKGRINAGTIVVIPE